ncbi:uncharacterized protein LOC134242057 [Saccostrea cucullata]|uniref:uncharacterized protein LOC134242057 n=1 Tax=Saccostrea cuccullata TaxID=36930 RepID=UPI002ED4157E
MRFLQLLNKRIWLEFERMRQPRKFILALTRPQTLKTLCHGSMFLIVLHYLIKFEQIKENGAFHDIDIPVEPDFVPLGIRDPEAFPTDGDERIPRIIHQTWKNEDIPSKFSKWVQTWVKNHPDWTYYLWTDISARQLIQERHPHLLNTFDSYTEGIRRADALRYVIMYEFGGIYADMDLESLKSVEPFTKKYACFVSQEPYEHPLLDGNFENLVINAIIGCRPKHPFMKKLMDRLPSFHHMWNVLDSTGPHFVTLVYRDFKGEYSYPDTHVNGTYLAPAEYFFPTIDPAKFFHFYNQCKRWMHLGEKQKKACKTLKILGAKRKPLPFSFTDHHWEHTYIDLRLSLKGPVNIHTLIPNAKIYKPNASV